MNLPPFDDSKELDLNTLAWVKNLMLRDNTRILVPNSQEWCVREIIRTLLSVMEHEGLKRADKIRIVVFSADSKDEIETIWCDKKEAVDKAVWGTHGKSGKDPLKWVRLTDCSTEHLLAIKNTQPQITDGIRYIIDEILRARDVLPYKKN